MGRLPDEEATSGADVLVRALEGRRGAPMRPRSPRVCGVPALPVCVLSFFLQSVSALGELRAHVALSYSFRLMNTHR